ncbi:hypothetical protein ACTGJ9_037815 [Bradyrhizobium sp. RDM12]
MGAKAGGYSQSVRSDRARKGRKPVWRSFRSSLRFCVQELRAFSLEASNSMALRDQESVRLTAGHVGCGLILENVELAADRADQLAAKLSIVHPELKTKAVRFELPALKTLKSIAGRSI